MDLSVLRGELDEIDRKIVELYEKEWMYADRLPHIK